MDSIRFVNASLHGILDYAAAFVLIAVPFMLNFQTTSPVAFGLSIAAGILLIAYSLLTDYGLSVAKLIPYNVHLILDAIAGLAFVVAPFMFGFDGIIRWFYLVNGVIVLILVLLSNPRVAKIGSQ